MIGLLGLVATALILVAAGFYLAAFLGRRPALYGVGAGAASVALALLFAEGSWHVLFEAHLPFTDYTTTAMSLSFLAAACALWADRAWKVPAVGAFLMPLVAVGQVVARTLLPELRLAADPATLRPEGLTAFLIVHVGLVFLGYGAIFVSAAASAMYLILDRDLRLGHPGPLYDSVPPLASSSFVAVKSLAWGIALLFTGLVLGLLRAWLKPPEDHRLLLDAKILAASLALCYFAGILLTARRLSPWRIAWLVVAGAVMLLVLHTGLAVAPGLHQYAP